jgi:hypothetical protein
MSRPRPGYLLRRSSRHLNDDGDCRAWRGLQGWAVVPLGRDAVRPPCLAGGEQQARGHTWVKTRFRSRAGIRPGATSWLVVSDGSSDATTGETAARPRMESSFNGSGGLSLLVPSISGDRHDRIRGGRKVLSERGRIGRLPLSEQSERLGAARIVLTIASIRRGGRRRPSGPPLATRLLPYLRPADQATRGRGASTAVTLERMLRGD